MKTKKLPRIINQEEFEKLFAETIKRANKKGISKKRKIRIKKYAIAILLGFEGGMRISEIVGYKQNKVIVIPELVKENIELNQIRIIGKGQKDRVVPKPKRLNKNAIDMLPLAIQRRPLQTFITKLGEEVLNKKISFHTLRAGFATHLINKGRPLHEVMMLMGHSRLDTTGIYLRASPKNAIDGALEVF